jgi:hypothetical protein
VEVGLYAQDGSLVSIGWAGSGWTDQDRDELLARWLRQEAGYVIRVKFFGLSFEDQMIRPSAVDIRPDGDKLPSECTFLSETGRERLS